RDHADVNAAKNIKAAGHAVSACGDLGTSRSVKQEPIRRATGRTPSLGNPRASARGGSQVPDKSPKVQMVTCGHPPPLILHARQVAALPSARPAPPLGLCEMFRPEYFVDTFALQAGDLLLLYTDGVIEARNSHGAFYPLIERVARWPQKSPPELVDRLCVDLLEHVGGRLTDDAAVIAIQRTQDAV
ncbi:SpoIIE family protein phosphatase, partial [Streptomyces sp. NPDC058424]|uniref:PP2C family protein-serine/threonine phosphatase n=1 Tax=Streptomyces sp. NPDC058424 TaxID=3346491 RepID=UPI003658DD6A